MNKESNIQVSPVNVEERKNLDIKAGDTVRVWQKIEEKGKTRLQAFEGVVLAVKHGSEPGATFTVRKVSLGVGVEKIFPLYSPNIDKIEVLKRAKVRRAKLYFVRDKVTKELRRIFRKTQEVYIATKGAAELEEERKRVEEELKRKQEEELLAKESEEKEAQDQVSEEFENNEQESSENVENTDIPDNQENSENKEESSQEDSPVEDSKDSETQDGGDDLTKIEGIGPKIAEALKGAGIDSFEKLASAKDEEVQEIIKDIPGNHKADTWNEQASLARDGKWDELKELQDKLVGGVAKDEEAQEAVEEVQKDEK